MTPRHLPGPAVSPTIPPTGPSSNIPTGPRAGASSSSAGSAAPSPSLASKPFNPPTGPAAQLNNNANNMTINNNNNNNTGGGVGSGAPGGGGGGGRQSLAQNLMASMPPIIPGGKLDPASTPLVTGVVRELEASHRRHQEEEQRARDDLRAKQDKLRRSLRVWDKLERDAKAFELKSDLSEKSLKNLAGEGLGGAAF
jgi:hypothetical protein